MPAPAPWEGTPKELRIIQAAMSEAHFILHAPPDFSYDAEILAVCGVSKHNSDQKKYGWIVKDFLQWKMLFHGVGKTAAQTWLSALDISEFLARNSELNLISGDATEEITDNMTALPHDNEGFEAEFLRCLEETTRVAMSRRTELVILIFAPVTPEQDICLDFAGEKNCLFADRLRDIIINTVGDVNLPVILITPSPFTGGWSCRPSFVGWPTSPTPEKMMRIVARTCGGAFASHFIKTFTGKDSPLMTEDERMRVAARFGRPMPLRPDELLMSNLHRFHRSIHESLEHRFSLLAREHSIIATPEACLDRLNFSDAWEEYRRREGRSIDFWGVRRCPSTPMVAVPDRFEFLGEAFGGTRESQIFHLTYLAFIEKNTCPRDWKCNVGGITGELLSSLGQRSKPSEDDAKRVFDTMEYRASSMIAAQMIAKAFDLSLPDGVKGGCRYWQDHPTGYSDDVEEKLRSAWAETKGFFVNNAELPREKRHEYNNVRFSRAARWLSATIASRFENGSQDDIVAFVAENIAPFIAKIWDTLERLLLEDPVVVEAGLAWIARLGLDST